MSPSRTLSPTAIGPGAQTGHSSFKDFDNSYTMSYGTDPDPYEGVPPHQIHYKTYNAKDLAIQGINNSFAPAMPISMPMDPYRAEASGHLEGVHSRTSFQQHHSSASDGILLLQEAETLVSPLPALLVRQQRLTFFS